MIEEKLASMPDTPGCYLFYDRMGNIIYVGKSKRLRSRVRSYFVPSAKGDERIAGLIREIADVTYVRTETELDALIEEYGLIKRYRPWFNAQHIRDARPHYLRVAQGVHVPAVVIAREAGEGCVGPFKDVFRAEEAMGWLSRVWRTPMCGQDAWPVGARPCVYHGMGRCFAPCQPERAAYPYGAELAAFLAGKPEAALDRLRREMAEAAAGLRFEEAGARKEDIAHVEALARRLAHSLRIAADTHAVLLMRGFGERDFSAFYIREGRVRNRVRVSADTLPEAAADAFTMAVHADAGEQSALIEACLVEIAAYRRFTILPADANIATIRDAYLALHQQIIQP